VKVLYGAVIEEFPDLVSRMSEVSSELPGREEPLFGTGGRYDLIAWEWVDPHWQALLQAIGPCASDPRNY